LGQRAALPDECLALSQRSAFFDRGGAVMKYEWHKHFHGTVFDPKFTAAAEIAGSEHSRVFAVWIAASDFASVDQDRGSVRSIDLRIVAAGVRLGFDEVKRIWAAFIELNMIALDRLVGWAEQQGVAKLVKAVSAGAERTRRYRQRKAEEARQGQSQPPDPGSETHDPGNASQASPSVTSGVTESVTVTVEEEGEALREREQVLKEGDDSCGRAAPLSKPQPSENIVKLSDSAATQKAKLKAKKKDLRRHKVVRFVCMTFEGDERERRMNGLQGYDEAHDMQWWLDHCDAERIAANWDDKRRTA
jgi:hypothetical protein